MTKAGFILGIFLWNAEFWSGLGVGGGGIIAWGTKGPLGLGVVGLGEMVNFFCGSGDDADCHACPS